MTAPECIFRCDHCGAVEVYDESRGFYLVAWWAQSEAFDRKHRACRATPPHAASAAAVGGGEV